MGGYIHMCIFPWKDEKGFCFALFYVYLAKWKVSSILSYLKNCVREGNLLVKGLVPHYHGSTKRRPFSSKGVNLWREHRFTRHGWDKSGLSCHFPPTVESGMGGWRGRVPGCKRVRIQEFPLLRAVALPDRRKRVCLMFQEPIGSGVLSSSHLAGKRTAIL